MSDNGIQNMRLFREPYLFALTVRYRPEAYAGKAILQGVHSNEESGSVFADFNNRQELFITHQHQSLSDLHKNLLIILTGPAGSV
jgi:hypothetical protein